MDQRTTRHTRSLLGTLVIGLAVAMGPSSASAQTESLRLGEVVGIGSYVSDPADLSAVGTEFFDSFIFRFDPEAGLAESLSQANARAIAILDRNTIYALVGDQPFSSWVWELVKIDVPSGDQMLIAAISDPGGNYKDAAVHIEPNGKLLVYLVQQIAPYHGKVYRVDPAAGTGQTPAPFLSNIQLRGQWGLHDLEVNAGGEIFVHNGDQILQILSDSSIQELWPASNVVRPLSSFDLDPNTGDLIFIEADSGFFVPDRVVRAHPDSPYSAISVVENLLQAEIYCTFALESDGDVVASTGCDFTTPRDARHIDVETGAELEQPFPFVVYGVEAVRPECANGLDDDGDGLVDVAGLLNGSFEVGSNPDPYFVTLTPGQTNMAEWSVGGEVDWVKSTLWQASQGGHSIDLSGNFPGSVYRTIQTRAGVHYTVTFDLAGNPAGTDPIKVVRVSAAGTSQDYNFDTTGKSFPDMGWETHQFEFTATTTETELRFEAISPQSAHGPVVDNIRIGDPDCRNADDNTEDTRACSDGLDNNNNGLIDYPNEPGCDDYDDKTECGSGAAQALVLLPFLWGGTRRRRNRQDPDR